MTDLTNLTHEQLRRMVELLNESGQRLLVACRFLNEGALIDSHGPMSVGIDLRTDAERIAHEPHEPDARHLIIDAKQKDVDYLRGVERKLTRQLERARKERDTAETERARLQRLFDDAGGEEYNVLALVDHYQSDWFRMEKELLDAQKALADRKTVEEWAVVETDEIDPDTRTVTHGRRRGVEYHWSPFGHYVNLTEDHRKRVELSARGDTADLAYAAAAEWVRGQG